MQNLLQILMICLLIGVIFVNGWTDAPNAIATSVATGSMPVGRAVVSAAILNFLGTFVMCLFNASVADTVTGMVNFSNDNRLISVAALAAGLFSVVLWAVIAFCFGIPTSESHALLAGISGAALAAGGAQGIDLGQWAKVLLGLLFSALFGFLFGFLSSKTVYLTCRRKNRGRMEKLFSFLQNRSAEAMAFMHGAQDGQKFIGVFVIVSMMIQGRAAPASVNVFDHLLVMVVCSTVMGIGTCAGGYKIIKTVGMNMVKIKRYQGFCADLSAFACLLAATLTGLPVSTTHTKTTAIMGAGCAKRMRSVNWSIAKEMCIAWVVTFPFCIAIGFALTKLLLFWLR